MNLNCENATDLCDPEVNDLEDVVGGEEQVSRLDVLVYDAAAVQVLQAVNQLAEVAASSNKGSSKPTARRQHSRVC